MGSPSWVAGRLNGALEFYGEDSNDYVDIDGGTGTRGPNYGVMGNGPITSMAWIKAPASEVNTHWRTIFAWGTNVAPVLGRWRVALNYGWVHVGLSGAFATAHAQKIADDDWHHVTTVLPDISDANANDILIYIDGISQAVDAGGPQVANPINIHDANGTYNDVYIGYYAEANDAQEIANGHPPEYWLGLIDEVRIYDRELDANEIVAAMTYDLGRMATEPFPDYKATNVNRDVTLRWTSGLYAASHDVYFGTDVNAVTDANTTVTLGVYKGNQALDANTYTPGPLLLETTYYWRVDEVNDANLWSGDVWRFTTGPSIIVDYFEKYVDTNTGEPNLLGTWSGLGGADVNLSIDPDPKHWGSRSMKVSYDNTGPLYSAASQTPSFSDWTDDGVEALYVWFLGDVNNTGAQLYIELEDNVGTTAKVIYSDANATLISDWTRWLTDLQDFVDANNVDLTNITKITLGIGDGLNASGTGDVWFDDIRLRRPQCWSQNDPSVAEGDVNNDCVIDFKDFAELANRWFETGMSAVQ